MPNEVEDMEVTDSPRVDEITGPDHAADISVGLAEKRAEPVSPLDGRRQPSVAGSDPGVMVAPPAMLSPVRSIGGATEPDVASPMAGTSDMMPPPFAGPQPIEILFSFDTTGSMSSCLEEVQNNLKTIINRLLMDIPSLKIAIVAHGDYCDAEHFYVTKTLDFTNDISCLFEFVTNCGGTGGGDFEECYELVLRKAREDFTWTPGTTKSVVMIGDAVPHPPGHGGNTANLDWREETDALYTQLGARVYAVQCLAEDNKQATPFWEELAGRTFGKHLQLDQLESIVALMMAICYREGGNPDMFLAYEREVRAREGTGMHRDLDRMFNTLRGDGTTPKASTSRPSAATHKKSPKKEVADLTRNTYVLKGYKKAHGTILRPEAHRARLLKKSKRSRKTLQKATNARYALRQQRRENIINQYFILNDLKWSPWKKFIDGNQYRLTGKRDHKLFNFGQNKSAIYEVSVQPFAHSKNYVVMFRTTQGIPTGVNWDTYIMRGKAVRTQLNSALAEGCNILVRRAFLPRVYNYDGVKYHKHRQVATLLRHRYNYAWMKSARGGSTGRELIRRGKVLSQELTPVA